MKPLQPYFCTENKGDQPKILLKEPPFVAVPIICLENQSKADKLP
jgi:hypothetical protein